MSRERRSAAELLNKDEAWRIAVNIAKLPERAFAESLKRQSLARYFR
jgi:hypothetical protein